MKAYKVLPLLNALAISLVLSGLPSTSWSQLKNSLRNEILAHIRPEVLEFPDDETGLLSTGTLTGLSGELRTAFDRFRVQTIAKAFPHFHMSDTSWVREDGSPVRLPQFSRIFRILLENPSYVDSAIEVFKRIPGVLFAERHSSMELQQDPTYGNQWQLNNTGQSGGAPGADIRAEQAWTIFTGSPNIKIGVIDSGVETGHEDLAGKSSGDLPDGSWHGTHVAGIAAATAHNGRGGRGVDWNAQILSRRIFDASGYVGDDEAGSKLLNAAMNGANILNNSWASLDYSSTLRLAFAAAYNLDRVTVASMGNYFLTGNPTQFPGAFGKGILAVGATTDNDLRSAFSQTGNHIDVSAPGGIAVTYDDPHNIWSTWQNSTYRYVGGTSMATPVVSGVASLLKGYNPSLYNDDIEQIIRFSADDINDPNDPTTGPGWDQGTGHGRVNAYSALRLITAPNTLVRLGPFVGGTTASISGMFKAFLLGVPGIADGLYDVERYEVIRDIQFPYSMSPPLLAGHNFNLPEAWGNGTATTQANTGLPYNNLDDYSTSCNAGALIYGLAHTEVVAGTVTATSCRLRTYVYRVYQLIQPTPGVCYTGPAMGFFPTSPSNVQMAATVLGVPPPLSVAIAGPSTVYHPDTKYDPPNCYTWTANVAGGVPSYTYTWLKDDLEVGAESSVELCFPFRWVGGSYQFTLSVNVQDAQSSMGSDSMIITAYYGGAAAPSGDKRVVDPTLVGLPKEFNLRQNFPNPFNPETVISFSLPEPSLVELTVLDVLGRTVAQFEEAEYSPGHQSVVWSGFDSQGNKAGSGIYFCRLIATGESGRQFIRVIKMTLAK